MRLINLILIENFKTSCLHYFDQNIPGEGGNDDAEREFNKSIIEEASSRLLTLFKFLQKAGIDNSQSESEIKNNAFLRALEN